MTKRAATLSPRFKARLAGLFYLMTMGAAFALFTRSTLIVRGDAAATAHNIITHEALYRVAFASELAASAAYIGVAALLYDLLKPVSRSFSLLAAFFALAGCAISAATLLTNLGPLIFLGSDSYLTAFTTEQLQSLALMFLKLQGQGQDIGIVFFGLYCVSIGGLIARSTFLPRVIGVLLMVAGVCYLTDTFSIFLAPAFAARLYPYILLPALLAEGSLTLWLILVGLNAGRWEQANAERGDR